MEHEPEQIADTASEFFGGMIESYDSLIRRCVPRYEEMTRRLLDYIPGRPERILELGCGTGNLTLRLAERFPDSELVYVDASQEMVDLTSHRLHASGDSATSRRRGVLGAFEEIESLVDGPFDLVTSCIALHHVVDKGRLYAAIANLMRSGGTLRFADQLLGGSEFNHDKNWKLWIDFCRKPENCTPVEIQSLLDHAAAHDHYTPLTEHFALLGRNGFVGLDCVWRNLIWGILTADRT